LDKKALKEIEKFVERLKEEINLKEIIFFGSRSRNDYLESSDIDLIIVSPDFKDVDYLKRFELVYPYLKELRIEFIPLTSEEFEIKRKQLTLINEAVREGMKINIH
jgi:hypothetical protein